MRSFVKIKPSQNGTITLLSTYVGNSRPSREFLASQLCLFMPHVFAKNSKFTVSVVLSYID